ncbi:MAG: GatB/YqeY domain-containing protein [Candidatus Aenigmarchaeota archaeon]|nr:GatB/YqeY domain-containing protein [Candidatus Aenigmarchaeota archaeon]
MASLLEKINLDFQQALKTKNSAKTSSLRLLKAALQNRAIELRAQKKELNEEDALMIVNREVKKIKDSITIYQQAKRSDLANKEKSDLVVLQDYLPAQLSVDELEKIVAQTINKIGATGIVDFGKVMKEVMPQVIGRADGQQIKQIVQRRLTPSLEKS